MQLGVLISTGSDFDRLWSEASVDVVDEHVLLLLGQIQTVQDGWIAGDKTCSPSLETLALFSVHAPRRIILHAHF